MDIVAPALRLKDYHICIQINTWWVSPVPQLFLQFCHNLSTYVGNLWMMELWTHINLLFFFYHLQLATEASWDQSCGNYCDSRNEDNHAICFVYMAKANLQIIGWTLDLKISLLKHAKILEILRCYKYSAWASSVSGIALFLHRLVTPFFFLFSFYLLKIIISCCLK